MRFRTWHFFCFSYFWAWFFLPSATTRTVWAGVLQQRAEYHFNRQDYEQAFYLWKQVLNRNPSLVKAVLKVSELKLMFEGRNAATSFVVDFLKNRDSRISGPDRKQLQKTLRQCGETFLTEQGQVLYLQALTKIDLGDSAGALGLLQRAHELEKDHSVILRLMATYQKTLGLFPEWYHVLLKLHENNPWGPGVDELAEAHIFFREEAKALEILPPPESADIRIELIRGVALFETGKTDQAIRLFQKMVEHHKHVPLHPMVFYCLGMGLNELPPTKSPEAVSYLKKFVSLAEEQRTVFNRTWDPYRLQEKMNVALKVLSELKTP